MTKKQPWFDSAILKEDESKTTENTRHYVLNNGTRKAVFAPTRMNCFDETQKVWRPVDNSLKNTNDAYVADLGGYTARFPKASENETVEIADGADVIYWEYLGGNKTVFHTAGITAAGRMGKRKAKLGTKARIPDVLNLSNASRAVYTGADGGVDIDYLVEGNNVKENILIKEKNDHYRYYFRLRLAGFTMKATDDGAGFVFTKTATDADGAEEPKAAFVMPAPFMYDANGARSDDVRYSAEKIENDVFIFSVEAKADWVNAEDRVFPVCIDPQLLQLSSTTDSQISVTHDRYIWCDCRNCSCEGAHWKHTGNPYYSDIFLSLDNSEKITATVRIKKSEIDLTRNRLISAKLVFPGYYNQADKSAVNINIGGNIYTHTTGTLSADITNRYSANAGDFTIELSMASNGKWRRFAAPTLEIEYQPLTNHAVRKTVSMGNGVNAELDVLSGNATVVFDDIEDPVLGIAVSHVYKPGNAITEYGNNFRLNLDEKLIKTSVSSSGAQYAYTDPHGDMHTFEEHFWRIGADGQKAYITSDLSAITADADGRLWLSGKEVFRELTTDCGLRASARFDGVINNAEWVEQRIDEEKQAEEQVNSYRLSLCNFVRVNKTTGAITGNPLTQEGLSSPDTVEAFLSAVDANQLLLSQEETLTYQSLITQKSSLTASQSALTLQKESLNNSREGLQIQKDAPESFGNQREAYLLQIDSSTIEMDMMALQIEEEKDGEKKSLYVRQSAIADRQRALANQNLALVNNQTVNVQRQKNNLGAQISTLSSQVENIRLQSKIVDQQLIDLNHQINLYVKKSNQYMEQFRSYYKGYVQISNQLKTIKAQVPVSYLIADDVVKGFNEAGDLVVIQDRYGKYTALEREIYTSAGATRITGVYDRDNRAMRFTYNAKNKLSEICNSLGEKVAFSYTSYGDLCDIKRESLPPLSLSYKTVSGLRRISEVVVPRDVVITLSYTLTTSRKTLTP